MVPPPCHSQRTPFVQSPGGDPEKCGRRLGRDRRSAVDRRANGRHAAEIAVAHEPQLAGQWGNRVGTLTGSGPLRAMMQGRTASPSPRGPPQAECRCHWLEARALGQIGSAASETHLASLADELDAQAGVLSLKR